MVRRLHAGVRQFRQIGRLEEQLLQQYLQHPDEYAVLTRSLLNMSPEQADDNLVRLFLFLDERDAL